MYCVPLPCLQSETAPQRLFQQSFDRSPFVFVHNLERSGYFSFEALVALAAHVAPKPNRWYVEEGETLPQSGWKPYTGGHPMREILESIAVNHSFVMLKRVNEEPGYHEIMRLLETELSELTGIDIASRYRDGLMTILITSPLRVTPYHIDGEANLLMQMSGEKSVYIFDGNDRDVLTAQELEAFWSGDIKAARYREELQNRAWRFDLVPGTGVTNPAAFPHWVKNGPNVSISLSTNFKRVIDDAADAYRLNRRLRSFGFHPTNPGTASSIDHAKASVYRGVRRVKRSFDHFSSRTDQNRDQAA